jgi:hypothetical protein
VAEGFRAALSVAAIIALNEYRPNHAHRAAATGLPCLAGLDRSFGRGSCSGKHATRSATGAGHRGGLPRQPSS